MNGSRFEFRVAASVDPDASSGAVALPFAEFAANFTIVNFVFEVCEYLEVFFELETVDGLIIKFAIVILFVSE